MITRPSEAQEELSWVVALFYFKSAKYRDLVEFWERQGIPIAPATEEDVAAFERSLGIRLPDEFRRYLLEVSGTGPNGDREYFDFYSLFGLKLGSEKPWIAMGDGSLFTAPAHFRPEDFLIFADYLQICYAYAIRIRGDASQIGEVVHWGTTAYSPICTSFRVFIDLYLADDPRLHDIKALS
ncbi:SMI1 / KNR4 family (SUKH-1) [Granulicella rosea]|uniref:SMI1 / KNR4 family (SUKH-1) n=1 Tax=Granulicella rosea TaxID=474952 RepID=A0A239HR41_9BACT|nr:SMI1/KNR4 family protein [Granulicella rosea]SNS82764.1 SMI1 / KNR4 family (SUKH-1) [Granulicella rosea]